MKRIGVDVGGTFTDLIYVDDQKGTVLVHKTPSTPADPSIATVEGIATLCEMAKIKPSDLDQVFHGTTVALNAFVGPKVSHYVKRFDAELRKMGVKTGVQLMTSAAGVATPQAASTRPVNLLMSGPIAGVVGGIWAGRVAGEPNVITLDVGGTSADIGLAQDGKLRMKHLLDTKVGPYQAMIPMVDVDTIGAGGGSIAYIDSGGIFRVGPRSAGAMPGPAAYDQGGTEPTATDAIIALGWLRSELFLGGKKDLRVDLARKAVETKIAKPLKLTTEEAALGIFKVLVHSMVDAIEQSSVRKGFDPREFALVAEGGGGPLFASHIAPEVGVKHVLVPNYPGITAALGLLTTDLVYEYTKTAYVMASEVVSNPKTRSTLEKQFLALEKEAMKQFATDKIDKKRIRLERIVDARYEGQGYELRVDAKAGAIDEKWVKAVKNEFHEAHEKEFSRRFEDVDVQIANIRVRAIGAMPGLKPTLVKKGTKTPPKNALKLTADAWFEKAGKPAKFKTKFYERTELLAGNHIAGPAIITQFDSTSVVPPGYTADVDKHGNLIIKYSAAVAKAAESGH